MAIIQSCINFNDEGTPQITYLFSKGIQYYNVYGCVCFNDAAKETPNGSDYKLLQGKATLGAAVTKDIPLTDAERVKLRKAMANNSTTIRYYIRYQDATLQTYYYEYATATISLVNQKPVITFSAVDVNTKTVALTGNDEAMIAGYSNAKYTMLAQPRKESTIKEVSVNSGGNYYYTNTGTINKISSNTFYLTARDSRNNTTLDAYVISNYIKYIKLTGGVAITAPLSSSGSLTFQLSGKYFKGSFGSVSNTFSVSYALTNNGTGATTTTNLGAVTPTVDADGNYTYSKTISGLSYSTSYDLTVTITDKLETVVLEPKTITGSPVFDWGKSDFKHYTDVYIANGKNIKTTTDSGTNVNVLGTTNIGSVALGYGNYAQGNGQTTIYGNNASILSNSQIFLTAPNGVSVNGREYGYNKLLWSGAYHMNASQTVSLSGDGMKISDQPNGIVLVFSQYDALNSVATNAGWTTHFVPKYQTSLNQGTGGQTFLMGLNAGFSVIGAKYLYITDTSIKGQASNTSTGTNSGITFNNNAFVLRAVIGV